MNIYQWAMAAEIGKNFFSGNPTNQGYAYTIGKAHPDKKTKRKRKQLSRRNNRKK